MTEIETISWILLATALASQKEPSDINSISMIADGINHSIPTEKELRMSLTWLINKGLILKQGKKYRLTEKGMALYELVSNNTATIMKIWENLNIQLTHNDLR